MEDYAGYNEEEKTLDAMLSKMVDDGIISMSWDEVDGLVYFMTDEQKAGIRVRYMDQGLQKFRERRRDFPKSSIDKHLGF